MKRHVIPAIEGEPKFVKRARVSKTASGHTVATVEVVPDDPTKATVEGDVVQFLGQAMRRFKMAQEAEMYNRTEGLRDVLMVDGEGQWDDDIRGKRQRKKRPCLTINRFIPMIAHVANEQRMSRPAIQVDPVGGGADVTDALVRQGLIRNIEIMSGAETIYDTAFERMIEKGWSWFRVVTDFESETSFNQVLRIEGFTNDFSVYSDPTAEEPTRKDQKWNFIVYDMPRGEYLQQYKGSKAAGLTNFASVGDTAPNWVTADSIRVAEYYYLSEEHLNSVKLIGGEGIFEDEIEERDGLWYLKTELDQMDHGKMEPEDVLPQPVELDDDGQLIKRPAVRTKPMWCKINAVEILDGDKGAIFAENTAGRRIPGKYIPMIMVAGRERMVRGQRRLSGMVRANRDGQRMYNYMASGFAEMIALAPKSPFVAAIGQIEEFKPIWDTLNEENWGVLPYKPKDVSGQLVPPPTRQNMEPPVAAYLQGLAQFDNIIKIGFNIFDPSLGSAKSDQSGRAIAGLQARSDSANMNWMDNMSRAQVFCGEVCLEAIPEVYNAERTITIDRANKKEQVVINAEFTGADGKKKKHDMAVGKFSCTVSLGQYASKRQAAVSSLTEIAKNVPQVSLALLPLILENMDSPMASDAAEIVKRMQPPQLQEPGSPEAIQSQFQAMQQQHQQLVMALERANDLLKTKALDAASKERIAGLQAQAQIVMALAKAGNAQTLQLATQEFQRITQALDQDHERQLAQQEAGHALALELVSQNAPQNQPAPAAQ